jgi:hypothetical protein
LHSNVGSFTLHPSKLWLLNDLSGSAAARNPRAGRHGGYRIFPLVRELGFEVWMDDPAEIKAKRVKKQKYDREDARLLLRLMRESNLARSFEPRPRAAISLRL